MLARSELRDREKERKKRQRTTILMRQERWIKNRRMRRNTGRKLADILQ
jgi:hypothetical protein